MFITIIKFILQLRKIPIHDTIKTNGANGNYKGHVVFVGREG